MNEKSIFRQNVAKPISLSEQEVNVDSNDPSENIQNSDFLSLPSPRKKPNRLSEQEIADYLLNQVEELDSKNTSSNSDPFKVLNDEIDEALKQNNFSLAITLLAKAYDLKKDIKWSIIKQENRADLLIRDARKINLAIQPCKILLLADIANLARYPINEPSYVLTNKGLFYTDKNKGYHHEKDLVLINKEPDIVASLWQVLSSHGLRDEDVKSLTRQQQDFIQTKTGHIAYQERTQPYTIMGLNNIRAAFTLFDIHCHSENSLLKEDAKKYLQMVARSFFEQTNHAFNEQSALSLLKHLNSVIITNLTYVLGVPEEKATSMLTRAKEFAILEQPSKDVATLFTLKDSDNEDVVAFQYDQCLSELTPDLISEYENRKRKDWYNSLPESDRALVDRYSQVIIQGNRVIPTQLRDLVGLRNSNFTTCGIFEPKLDCAVVTTSYYHSGTIVCLGRNEKENQRINELHAQQLQYFTGTESVFALTLNSENNPIGNDKTIVTHSRTMMKKIGGLYSNLPLNRLRSGCLNDYSGIDEILKQIANDLLPELKKEMLKADPSSSDKSFFIRSKEYLCREHKRLFHDNEIFKCLLDDSKIIKQTLLKTQDNQQKIRNTHLCEILDLALQLCNLIYENTSIVDGENLNLQIGCLLKLLFHKLNSYNKVAINSSKAAINSSCESGKDRDGILVFRTALLSFINYLFGHYKLKDDNAEVNAILQHNIIVKALADHEAFIAGWQAGLGPFGIKEDSESVFPRTEFPNEAKEQLIKKSASYNKKIPKLAKNDVKRYHFDLHDDNLDNQKQAISHILKMKQKELEALLLTCGNFRMKSVWQGSTILSKTVEELSNLIQIMSDPTTNTFSGLTGRIYQSAQNIQNLTKGTLYSIPDTYFLLQHINTAIGELANRELKPLENR